MSKEKGRTFWDWITENRNLFVFISILIFLLIGFGIDNGYSIKFPEDISIEKPSKVDDTNQRNKEDAKANEVIAENKETHNQLSATKEKTEKIQRSEPLIISIKDEDSKEPIPNAKVNINYYPNDVLTDNNGRFTVPNSIIEKYGVYNSIKVTISKEGFKTEELNIALSENYSIYIKKSQ